MKHLLRPNDLAHLPRRLENRYTPMTLIAAAVRCRVWFGGLYPLYQCLCTGNSNGRRNRE